MNYDVLYSKKQKLAKGWSKIPKAVLERLENSFNVEYAHNSTAIEGNTLTLIQTKAILEEGLSVGGKSLREIYEVVNHAEAFTFIKKCTEEGRPLDEVMVKDVHALLMNNILVGGIYRNVDVRISGAGFKPASPNEMFSQIKEFFTKLSSSTKLNPIELAAWTHAELVKIHPFVDGNGRTSRMLMNYQLMAKGFLPISIAKETRLEYFDALEAYATGGDLMPFTNIIANLEEIRLDEYLAIVDEEIIKKHH